MRRVLLALLVAAAFARAEGEERMQTTEGAVRGYLAETPVVDLAAETLSGRYATPDVTIRGEPGGLVTAATALPRGGPGEHIVAAAEATTKPWDIKGTIGFTLTDGNSDTITLLVGVSADREWEHWKLGMKIGIIYAEADGTQTASEWIFTERLERKLSERATIFQDFLLEHDEEEDLRYRIQFTMGYNRRLVKKEKFELWGNVGGGVLHEEFFDDSQTEGIAQLGINFTWQITKNLKYEQIITFYPSLSESGEFRMYWESRFTTPISDRLDLRLTILDRYDSNPQPGIKENDLTVAIALAIKFTKPPEK